MAGAVRVPTWKAVPEPIVRAIGSVVPPDAAWARRAAERQARLTMPLGSLGRLLEVGRQLASLQRTDQPVGHPALVAVFAADHGIASSGVSAYPAEVTAQMVANYLRGGAAVNVLARRARAAVRIVDMGVAHPIDESAAGAGLELIRRPIAAGTRSFLEGPAMTREEAFRAFSVGLEMANEWVGVEGHRVVALGEMGIGNSTTAAVLIAGLLDLPATKVVGWGTGVDVEGLLRKQKIVEAAQERHRRDLRDDWDWLARVGGFEILGLAGLAIGAAQHRALVVLDGLISTAAGLIATRLCPNVRGALIAAHVGPEPGQREALGSLGLEPLMNLGLRLGEGTGATLALPLIACAADLMRDMATFDSAGVSGPVVDPPEQLTMHLSDEAQ